MLMLISWVATPYALARRRQLDMRRCSKVVTVTAATSKLTPASSWKVWSLLQYKYFKSETMSSCNEKIMVVRATCNFKVFLLLKYMQRKENPFRVMTSLTTGDMNGCFKWTDIQRCVRYLLAARDKAPETAVFLSPASPQLSHYEGTSCLSHAPFHVTM
jgi:hypothetical protein